MKTAAKTSGTSSVAETASGGRSMPAVAVLQQKGKEKDEASIPKIPAFNDGAVGKFSPPPANTAHADNRQLTPFTAQKKAKGTTLSQSATGSLLQKNDNNTGLPDNLKSGIEDMSGFSMDDVKVHYNSGKPAQLKAFAYAQGADIHIGPGQEKHLPHEAWHVVQQKQGRVKPTLQLKGLAVNDDTALEQEADVMGAKALSTQQPVNRGRLQTQSLSAGMPNQLKVVQLVASQIQLNRKGLVHSLIIQGRPPRLYGDTMGDHTTSFIIQIEGLNIALKDKTLQQVHTHLVGLYKHLTLLPGLKYLNKESIIGEAYDKEIETLTNALDAAGEALDLNDQNQALQFLQTAISTYLHARELVPFSTINVSVKSKGTAGKGRGESSAAGTLSAFEFHDKPIPDDVLVNAAYKLFDDRSAGMASIEKDTIMFALMTGRAIIGDVDLSNLFAVIWQQHVDTIQKMYPKVYAKITKQLEGANFNKNLRVVKEKNIIRSIVIANNAVNRSLLGVEAYNRDYKDIQLKDSNNDKDLFDKLKSITSIYDNLEELSVVMAEIVQLNNELGNKYAEEIIKIEEKLQFVETQVIYLEEYNKETKNKIQLTLAKETRKFYDAVNEDKTISSDEDSGVSNSKRTNALKNIGILKTFQGGNPLARMQPSGVKPNEKLDENIEKAIIEKATPKPKGVKYNTINSTVNSMSVQITLKDNNTILEMQAKGRPPSPFKGTMGAHSTSWVVHLDRVRALIVGQSIPDAAKAIIAFSKSLIQKMETSKGAKGNNFKAFINGANQEIKFNIGRDPQKVDLSLLQRMINGALTYLNLIPGVTRDKNDTGGKGEGTHRKVIKRFMDTGFGSRGDLWYAVNGLYDGGNSGLAGHYKHIEEAYKSLWTFLNNESIPEKTDTTAPKNYPKTSEINKSEISLLTSLDQKQTEELDSKASDNSWLTHVNNCLINAITDAAGIARATAEQIILIRKRLGVPVGEMLYATKQNLDIILNVLHLNQGAVVVYAGTDYVDESTGAGDNALFIYHNGINHFTALYDPGTQEKLPARRKPRAKSKKRKSTPKKKKPIKKRKRANSKVGVTDVKDVDKFTRDPKRAKFKEITTIWVSDDKEENKNNSDEEEEQDLEEESIDSSSVWKDDNEEEAEDDDLVMLNESTSISDQEEDEDSFF